MLELLDIFILPFPIQGIAVFNNKRIVIANRESYTDVDFNAAVVCYLRKDTNTTYSRGERLECELYEYIQKTTMNLVVIDYQYKYNIDSIQSVIHSQLNGNEGVFVTSASCDFEKIKNEEQLSELKDGQLFKIVFNYQKIVVNDCDEIICNC